MPYVPLTFFRDVPDYSTSLSAENLNNEFAHMGAYVDVAVLEAMGGVIPSSFVQVNTAPTVTGQVPTWTGTAWTPSAPTGPIVTPMTFGAVGDGTTDDTVALQNAANSIATNGGLLDVSGAPKTYLISSPIILPDKGVTVRGRHVFRNKSDGSVNCDITCKSTFSGLAAIINTSATGTGAATLGLGVTIQGVSVNMSNMPTSGTSDAIRLMGRNMRVMECCLVGAPGNAIWFTDTNAGGTVAGGSSFPTDNIVVRNRISGFGICAIQSGSFVGGPASGTPNSGNNTDGFCQDNIITGFAILFGDAINNSGPAIAMANSEDWWIAYNHVQHVAQDGMRLENGDDLRVKVNTVDRFGSAQASSATYHAYWINNVWDTGVTMSGNKAKADEVAACNYHYYSFNVHDSSGNDVTCRLNDNVVHQNTAGGATSYPFKLGSRATGTRKVNAVGDGNVTMGPDGTVGGGTFNAQVLYTGNTQGIWVTSGHSPVAASSIGIPIGTNSSYGTTTTLLSPALGSTFVRLRGVTIHWVNVGSETLNVRLIYTWDDGTTSTADLPTVTSTQAQTPAATALTPGTLGNRCILVQARAQTTALSTSATCSIDAVGDAAA